MNIKTIKISFLLSFFVLFFFSCGDGDSENDAQYDSTKLVNNSETNAAIMTEEVPIVCIWAAVSLKESPDSKGKYITTIYLGEVASTFGEIVTDSSTSKVRDYVKIKLVDGTEGWIQENLMAINARPHVIKSKTKLYKRPDILTAGNKEFDRMQFVVVTETQDDWMNVKGKIKTDGWFTEGWVKASHLTESEIDITVAVLAERAMNITDREKKIKALNDIIGNPDLSGSQFIYDLQDMAERINMDEFDQSEVEEGDGD